MGDDKGGSKRIKNPVSEMLIWTDYIQKENKIVQVYDKFTLNPASIKIVSDKPNVNNTIHESKKDPNFEQTVKSTFDNYYAVPKKKQTAPQTASQEIGWNHDIQTPEPFQNHKRGECVETSFAANFCYMKGHSLYSNKNKL